MLKEGIRRSRIVHWLLAVTAAGITAITMPAVPRAQQPGQAGQAAPAIGDILAGLKWRNIGPNRGGRSIAVAGSTARPLEYYFAATGGGVWKTTDGGTTWQPVADRYLKTSSPSALAVAESNPDIVYVGMGETQLRGNIIQGDGVYKTTDGGKTWQHMGLEKTMAIARVRVHPRNPDLVWVAALGNPYGASPDRGVYRSTDGGRTWQRTLFRDEKTGAVDIALDPNNPDVIFAGLWEVYRTPHSLSSGGPGSGLFKSTDGGVTWTELTRNPGLPGGIWGKVGVSVSGADSNRVYAIIENAEGGVFRSDDGGATWTRVNSDRQLRQRAFYYTRIYADPKDRDTVYVLNVAFHRSTDGGKTYRTIRVPHGDNHDLWIAPNDPKRMINANDGGANVTFNGGESWTDQDYPTAQFYNVVTTRHVPYHVCGAQQDNSTACVSSAGSADVLYDAGGCESGYIAPDPRNLNVFFAGCYGGSLTRLDRATGQRRAINVWPENPMGQASQDLRERVQWTFPIVFHPLDPNVLFTGSQHLWRSTNDGQSWERISGDLTRADPSTLGPSGGPITLDQTGVETYATIFTIAPSYHERDTIWVGSDDGLVHITRDGGKSWSAITPPDLPPFARISLIEASRHKAGTAYLAANRYQRNDRAPYVYRSDDYGRTWVKIVGGLPGDDFPRVIREDPRQPGLLYLGTEHGVYVSFDNGGRWHSIRGDLPVVSVQGLVIHGDDVVIGTHGRSFYILPYAHVLRAVARMTQPGTLETFTPTEVTRYRPLPFASIWRGAGGGFGAAGVGVPIDYYLARDADEVVIEIADASGKVIRSYKGSAKDAETREEAPEGFGPPRPPRVEVKRGLHRVVWNLRHADATSFPGMILWAGSVAGPLVPPGTYTVRVSAHGETKSQQVTVKRDERVAGVSDDDLRKQFELASAINAKVGLANATVIRIRNLKSQIEERAKAAGGTAGRGRDVATAAESLVRTLTDIEGEIYQWRNQSNQDPLNFPIKLNNKLAALQGVVESSDHRPTDQSYAVFEYLSKRLDEELARLDGVVRRDVAAFNRLLARRGQPAVTDSGPAAGGGAGEL